MARDVCQEGALWEDICDEDDADAEEEFDPAHEKIWQQNAVLCQNFDELKRLYVQSTQINLQLQATCSTLQHEKEKLQKAFCDQSKKYLKATEPSAIGHPVDEYTVVTMPEVAPNVEAGTGANVASDSQRNADAKAFCEGCSRSRSTCHNRDAVIFNLEQTMQQLENHLRSSERSRSSEKKEIEVEVKRLHEAIAQKEKNHAEEVELKVTEAVMRARREEERQREFRRGLENEVSELRVLLTAVEQASAEAELRHLHSMNDLTKEKEALQEEVLKSERKCRMTEEDLLKVQKDLTHAGTQIDDLWAKLNEAANQHHEAEMKAASFKNYADELERKLQVHKEKIANHEKVRENDRLNHELELDALQKRLDYRQQRQEDAFKDKSSSLHQKISRLQKKLKQSHKQIAKLTVDCSELLIHQRTQMAVLESAKQTKPPHQPSDVFKSKAKSMSSELDQLSSRQAKYIGSNIWLR